MSRYRRVITSTPETLGRGIGLPLRTTVCFVSRIWFICIAAAVTVVTLVLPSNAGQESAWTVGLSSVSWKKPATDQQLRLMTPKRSGRENISIVILFKGFEPPPSQEWVDTLYRALTPPWELETVFEFTSPAQARQTLRKERVDPADPEGLVRTMGRGLPVSRVLVVRLLANGNLVTVQCDLREAKTGNAIGRQSEESVPKEHLTEKLRSMAHSLLSASRSKDRG